LRLNPRFSRQASFTYNSTNGLLAGWRWTNGLEAAFGYDLMDRMTGVTWRTSVSNVLLRIAYRYNAAGMATNVAFLDGRNYRYAYDELDRLVSETCSGAFTSSASFAYDPVGNRTQKVANGATVTYAYPYGTSGNRLNGWSATNVPADVLRCDVRGQSTETIGTNVALAALWVSNEVVATPAVSGNTFVASNFPLRIGSQTIVAAIGDAAGNVAYVTNTFTVLAVTNAVYTYDAAGCVTAVIYRAGNCIETNVLRWDDRYLLTAFVRNGSVVESNRYDALGRRIAAVNGDGTNAFLLGAMGSALWRANRVAWTQRMW
jgi:YD repeat-containing protein